MHIHDAVPDPIKIALKDTAFGLYRLSERFFSGPFDRYDFQAITIIKRVLTTNSNCIDVGANRGHILREMIKAAPGGEHIAFEPIPALASQLRDRYGGRATICELALADREGESQFSYYTDSPALSGFKERKCLTANHAVTTLKVRTGRLDDTLPAERSVQLIKIDVEGAEYFVLKGGVRTLRRQKPIVLFESGLGGADEFGVTPEQIFDLLYECGLSVSLMEYYLKGREPLTRAEYCGQFNKGYNYFYIAYDASGPATPVPFSTGAEIRISGGS